MSSRHKRLSVAIELFIARINAAAPLEKCPPQIGLDLPVRLIFLLLLALAATACDRQKPPGQQGGAAAGTVEGVDRRQAGKPFPDIEFGDPEGTQTRYEGFRGIPTLINLWATWCAPCVKELPTLNALAKSKGADLWVVPISQDAGPHASVQAFLEHLKLDQLHAYHDPKMALSGALGVEILPTSILYDSNGREVWRYVGDLDWTSKEAAALLAEAR